ncbi:MAG: hypothetical protein QXU18_02325 [Thermoplasmatales archaeon]
MPKQTKDDFQLVMQENLFHSKRQELLIEIQNELEKKLNQKVSVASYVANTSSPIITPLTMMSISHIMHFEDIVKTAKNDDSNILALILETYGGESDFPEEALKRIHLYFDEFYVVTVNICKSAGTLLSLLSNKLISVKSASFGPVDPQLLISGPQGNQSIAARSVKETMESTIQDFVDNKIKNIPAQFKPSLIAAILTSQNYLIYQNSLDAIAQTEKVIDKYLKPRTKIDTNKLKKELLTTPLSHAQGFSIDDLGKLGIDILSLDPNDDLARIIIEYHRRALRALIMEVQGANTVGTLLFENQNRSLQINAMVQQVR